MNFGFAFESINVWFQGVMAWFSNSTSAMDLHTAVICAGVFVISALVVYLISVFGMRERTYEEAIEEQRRRQQEAVQQSKSDKSKKEKKFKKWGKKVKEKTDEDKNINGDSEKNTEETEAKFDNESTNISSQGDLKTKRRGRSKKLTLQDKNEEMSSEDTDEQCSANTLGSTNLTNSEEEKIVSSDKILKHKEEVKTQTSESSLDLADEKVSESESLKIAKKSPIKKTRKNKIDNSDFNQRCETGEWTEVKLLNAIKMTTFTEDEVQRLMDVLNSKVKNSVVEKKKNEILSLKKLIQEKEEDLKCEQKLYQAATEQINDLIQELNEKKTQASTTEKSLRDALHQEQQEIKALHGMMQRKREQYAAELASMQSKMQQMKNKMKEEHSLALQRLQEENNQLQSLSRIESEKQQRSSMEIQRLQHEVEQLRTSHENFETHQAAMQQSQEDLHRQIQQLEKHIEQLVSSHQEEEYSYKQRINEMSNKIQQTESARSSLVQELQNAQSVCSSLEADNTSLRQRLEDTKLQFKNSEEEILQLQKRLEESNHQQRELSNCLEKLRGEVMELSNTKHEHLQVIQSLKKEYETLRSQKELDHQQQNGEASQNGKFIDIEKHESVIKEKDVAIHQLTQELDQLRKKNKLLSSELDYLKKENKELLDEKCKVSEALFATELKLKEAIQTAEKKLEEAQISCSKDMQNILNEQLKELELSLQEKHSREIWNLKQEAEKIKQEADERILKSEIEANLRLEEFQESLYERLNQINFESEEKIKESIKEKELVKKELNNAFASIKEFLCRIFPNICAPENFDNMSVIEYEKEVKYYLEMMKKDSKNDSKELENMAKKLEENAAEKISLESQIKKYESVLSDTENILKTVQNNVETEEQKWKKELETKETFLKETLCEIEELKLKLQKEELEKKSLQDKLNTLESVSNISASHTLSQIPEVNGAPGKK